jgi:predicted ATPase
MLQQIEVDGFKSLTNFHLELRPGLNILAGPNGSGKSSIILFLEFLSHIASVSVMQAVSKVGGAGAIFTHLGSAKLKDSMSFTISGVGDHMGRYRSSGGRRRTFAYRYSAAIVLQSELASLSFQHQSLEMTEVDAEDDGSLFPRDAPTKLSIVADATAPGTPVVTVLASDSTVFRPVYLRDESRNLQEFLESTIAEDLSDNSLLSVLYRVIDPVTILHADLVAGRAYNIDPNAVRQLEDIASEPGIRYDGSGLAATLFAAKKAKVRDREYYFLSSNQYIPADLLGRVSQYAQLVNENITGIDVESSPLENKLRIELHHRCASEWPIVVRMPISLASDGTVKWLALITAIMTSTSAIAIEEPENFLHPHMQIEIIRIVRERTRVTKRTRMFAIMTTHSETLLNAADPDEIIVVSMVSGVTRAARPENVDELRKEISDTGFGVGHFYVSGMVS